jgi:hypothetical protein
MPMNYKDNFEMLQKQHKALELKHKNLRACVSGMTQQLRELDGPWDKELECKGSWPEVPSFGIYMQLLQALMGAAPPEFVPEEQARESRKKFKVLD